MREPYRTEGPLRVGGGGLTQEALGGALALLEADDLLLVGVGDGLVDLLAEDGVLERVVAGAAQDALVVDLAERGLLPVAGGQQARAALRGGLDTLEPVGTVGVRRVQRLGRDQLLAVAGALVVATSVREDVVGDEAPGSFVAHRGGATVEVVLRRAIVYLVVGTASALGGGHVLVEHEHAAFSVGHGIPPRQVG